jgi:hypothetical protein
VKDYTNAKRWTRATLVVGIIASITGNVADVVTAETEISLALRVPQAVFWPAALFLAIEVLIRVPWSASSLSRIGRPFLLSVAIPTAITSFLHLHDLMIKSGEPGLAQLTGPLAIDGLMLGATIALLVIRQLELTEQAPERLELTLGGQAAQEYAAELANIDASITANTVELTKPISPAPQIEPVERERAPRWDAAKVCEMAVDGVKAPEAKQVAGIGVSTYGRYTRVAKALKAEPGMEIPAEWKVPAEDVRRMRGMVAR